MWNLIIWISLFILGYVIIYFSADFFIDNLKDMCVIFGVSPFIIGLIVLGIDPEESIASIVASLSGFSYLALGNVIGNTILSLSLCFALPAFFYKIDLKKVSGFYFILLYACLVVILLSFFIPMGLFMFGFISIGIYLIYLFRNIRHASKDGEIEVVEMSEALESVTEDIKNINKKIKIKKILVVLLGLVFIFLGGELLVISAENLILLTGISEEFFGFIIIAFVTNVEELTLVFKSIKKGSLEIGLGGMIGKIIWNLSFTFGVSGIIAMNINFSPILLLNWLILLGLILYYHFKSTKKFLNKKDAILLTFFLLLFLLINLFLV